VLRGLFVKPLKKVQKKRIGEEFLMTPAEFFGKEVIGYAVTPPMGDFPAGRYEVLEVIELLAPAGKSYMVNKWFTENNRTPLYVVEQFGAKFEPLEEK